MKGFGAKRSLLRLRHGEETNRVTFVELFFDLVFVFAVTQLSHTLLDNLTLVGFFQTALLFIAIWWVWIDTSWVTNWLDPQTTPVRLMLFLLMLVGLVLSVSIPSAFGARGMAFAAAFAAMQVGRTLFVLWCMRHHSDGNYRNFQRIAAWLTLSALVWVAGAFTEGNTRLAIWSLAALIDCAAPAVGYWMPRLGRSRATDWDVEGSHMAERCGLFIIIALGESILVAGNTFGRMIVTPTVSAAFVVALVGSIAMWWIYFNIGAEQARHTISKADDPGRLARLAYTYFHIPIVAGIIVSAVADEMVLAHPTGHVEPRMLLVVLGGPALYLAGNILFKRTIWGRMPLSHLVGLGTLAALIPLSAYLSPLSLAGLTAGVLVAVAIWETRSLGGAPTPVVD